MGSLGPLASLLQRLKPRVGEGGQEASSGPCSLGNCSLPLPPSILCLLTTQGLGFDLEEQDLSNSFLFLNKLSEVAGAPFIRAPIHHTPEQ